MGLQNEQKIMKLMQEWQPGTVATSAWLEKQGISRQLRNKYLHSGWIASVGSGAYQKSGDPADWKGGLYALQSQSGLFVHAGALTALSMQGLAHYMRFEKETVFLFSPSRTALPKWFENHDWKITIHHARTSFLPETLGLMDQEEKNFTLCISAPERAILECLYLTPKAIDIIECYQLMASLSNLRPKVMQSLLESCASVKVKRLFLYMAEKSEHSWLDILDTSTLNLGKGDRSITQGGEYIAKYHITIPKELAVS